MIERRYFAPQPLMDLDLKQTALINTIPFVFKTRYIYKNFWKPFYVAYRIHVTKRQNIILDLIKLERLEFTPPIKNEINRLKMALIELN